MKVTHKVLLASQGAFHELTAQRGMGAVLSHRIGRNFRLYNQAVEFYHDTYNQLLADCEDKTKRKGDQVYIPPEKQQTFHDEVKKLNALEVEIDFHQILAKDLQDKKLDLSPTVWANLYWLIQGEPSESESQGL